MSLFSVREEHGKAAREGMPSLAAFPCSSLTILLSQSCDSLLNTCDTLFPTEYLHCLKQRRCCCTATYGDANRAKELPRFEAKLVGEFAHWWLHHCMLPLLEALEQSESVYQRCLCTWSIHVFLNKHRRIEGQSIF